MKKKLFLAAGMLLSGLLLFAYGCESSDDEIDVPSCIEDQIQQILSEPVRNPPAAVWKWEVDGQTFYYITSDCCDQFNYLYDTACDIVCAPDGGINGEGDGNCPEFSGQIEKTLVWEDQRS